jgi:hypothetical protein
MITETTTMRRCIGSKTLGIEAHGAPADEFPVQPSQKDGLGRMCKPHWRQYTKALREAAAARKAIGATSDVQAEPEAEPELMAEPEPPATRSRRTRKAAVPETGEDVKPVDE